MGTYPGYYFDTLVRKLLLLHLEIDTGALARDTTVIANHCTLELETLFMFIICHPLVKNTVNTLTTTCPASLRSLSNHVYQMPPP